MIEATHHLSDPLRPLVQRVGGHPMAEFFFSWRSDHGVFCFYRPTCPA